MRFTLRQIEYFIAACETGSITQASERINISQPSISTAISQLEQELGVQLFIRHRTHGLSLTPVGRAVLLGAKRLVGQAEGLYAVAAEAADEVRGQLSVGYFVTLAPMVMPGLSHSFATEFPAARIQHMAGDHEQILRALRQVTIEVGVTYDLELPTDIDFQPLTQLPPHAVLSGSHPLAERETVSLQELAKEPLILLDLPISRDYFLALFLQEGLSPRIVARSAYQEVVRTMVANGYGYTLANVRPRTDLALDGKALRRVALSGKHRPMTIGLATVGAMRKTRLVEAFGEHCVALLAGGSIPGMAPSIG